jgi:hypothetical protein
MRQLTDLDLSHLVFLLRIILSKQLSIDESATELEILLPRLRTELAKQLAVEILNNNISPENVEVMERITRLASSEARISSTIIKSLTREVEK